MSGVRLIAIACFALLACAGCTPAEQQTASQIVSVAEVGCILVVSVEAPGAGGLCVTGEELAQELVAFVAAHAGAPVPVTTTPDGKTVVPAAVHAALATRIAARKVKAAPTCKPGMVAP